MAKIVIEIDTEEKEMTVMKDGQEVKNVDYVCAYSNENYGGFSCNICTREKEESGMSIYTQMVAAQANAIKIFNMIRDA